MASTLFVSDRIASARPNRAASTERPPFDTHLAPSCLSRSKIQETPCPKRMPTGAWRDVVEQAAGTNGTITATDLPVPNRCGKVT